jgi:hypothetical protein
MFVDEEWEPVVAQPARQQARIKWTAEHAAWTAGAAHFGANPIWSRFGDQTVRRTVVEHECIGVVTTHTANWISYVHAAETEELPPFTDDYHGCEMELLGFDSRKPHPKYEILEKRINRLSDW